MREVCIIGIGQTPIGELWDKGLRHLAFDALKAAVEDAGLEAPPEALYVGNMLAARLSDQAQLGALIADFCGWRGIEAKTVEAACASGGVAFQAGVRAVASGMIDVAAVCGVEKMMDKTPKAVTSGLATASDADYEAIHGANFVILNALIMQRYMYEYKIPHEAFGGFSINAHKNAINNPNAMYRKEITQAMYDKAHMIAAPINLYDSAPICDGSAAAILCPVEMVDDITSKSVTPVKVLASVTATDCLNLDDRHDLLTLEAGRMSAQKAYQKAGITPDDVDVDEVHDAFSIIATLSLEAAGFAEPGQGTRLAQDGEIALGGRVPISTMGGLKARGHPVGATGVYEIIDLVTQLRGEAGKNQVKDATIGLTQNIGGTGSTIVTHILGLD